MLKHYYLSRAALVAAFLPAVLVGCSSEHVATKPAAAGAPHSVYFDANAIKLEELLPKPSPDKSPISKGEGDLMIAIQAEASPASKERMKVEENLTPWIYADVLGPGFTKEKKPLTAELLDKAWKDARVVIDQAKDHWDRTRPPRQDARIAPLLKVPTNASYPSGHATLAIVYERVLSALDPKDKDALRARARLVALDRVIASVHYPTDVAAGMALGDAIADQLLASAAFRAELDKAKVEWGH